MFLPDSCSPGLLSRLGAALSLCLLTACAGVAPVERAADQDVAWLSTLRANGGPSSSPAMWQHCTFPGKKPTHYRALRIDGHDAVQSDSSGAASMLRQSLRVEPGELGRLGFSWKATALITGADLTQRDSGDSPVRLVLAFEGDRSRLSAKNAMLSELALALTGEPMPYATLMYVWGNQRPPGSVIVNSRTDRIRKLVLESGPGRLGRWLDYERDIRADYEKAFGEPPGALVGIALMTDTDNTRQQTRAWYGPVTLLAKSAQSATADFADTALSGTADSALKP
ncbi:DUF3047 domain-containing protein [Polaromonas sp. P1(28)-8]|nr:DUF3047 domain-containing protein [Polaromonas sp. P1(28)-8]